MHTEVNPYERPQSNGNTAKEFQNFRLSFLPPWLLIGLGTFTGTQIVSLILSDEFSGDVVVHGLFCAGYAAATSLAIAWFLRVQVCDQGLRCGNFWGAYSFVSWQSITDVKPTRFIWLPYLRIFAPSLRWPIWLPLFLQDESGFWITVLPWLKADSPLAIVARARGTVDQS